MWHKFLLFLFLCIGLNSFTAAINKPLELATGEYPPYVSSKLVADGFIAEMVRQVFRRAGYEVHLNYLSWLRVEEMTKTGRALAAFPYKPTPERQTTFDFSSSLADSPTLFFYYKPKLKSAPETFHSLDELQPYRIAAQLGYWYLPLFSQHHLNTLFTPDEETAIKQLQTGNLDLAPMLLERGYFLIEQQAPERFQDFGHIKTPLDNSTTLNLMFSRRYPNATRLRAEFETALKSMQRDGSLKAIYQHYFPKLTAAQKPKAAADAAISKP
ncbi:transporter substrate-binding domain-containing protein [Neisseriaceae bacterium TC5R-5]|nr:transporter substrate-binding domain-containing protein [Neisseriaceae bacterium TC5R-5]